jgi:hypothetical protein
MVNDAFEEFAARPFWDVLFERRASGSDQPLTMPNFVTVSGLQSPSIEVRLVSSFGDSCVQFDIAMQIPYPCHMLEVAAELFVRRKTLRPLKGAPYCWVGETIVGELAVNSGTRVSLYAEIS